MKAALWSSLLSVTIHPPNSGNDREIRNSMLKIYNTLTNQKDTFVPIEEGKVRMYVCGMTVYDYCHLGHARVMVVFDVVVRYLRARGYEVTYVRNITDVDDKIIARAVENLSLIHISEPTRPFTLSRMPSSA